jgi:hypothetical protein
MSIKLFGPKRDPHTGLAFDAPPIGRTETVVVDDHATVRERQAAYGQGRADQKSADHARVAKAKEPRRRKGGFGLFTLLFVIAAAIGVTWVVLAYQTGSFASGGAVVDRKVAEVTEPAKQAAIDAADRTGAAVQSAGQAVEAQGAKLRQKGEGATP